MRIRKWKVYGYKRTSVYSNEIIWLNLLPWTFEENFRRVSTVINFFSLWRKVRRGLKEPSTHQDHFEVQREIFSTELDDQVNNPWIFANWIFTALSCKCFTDLSGFIGIKKLEMTGYHQKGIEETKRCIKESFERMINYVYYTIIVRGYGLVTCQAESVNEELTKILYKRSWIGNSI